MAEKLFEITTDELETGLRGFPIGYCTTSTVDPKTGLFYSGYPVNELLNWTCEEVIYLLYTGKKGDKNQIEAFNRDLRARSKVSPKTIQHIQLLPREGHPMKLFSSSLLIAGMFEGKDDYKEDCLNLIAKAPEVVATLINFHAGWGGAKPSKPELGYIENFVYMLNVPNVDPQKLIPIFKMFNILHYDHGGGNLSTFIGKAVASSLEDMYGSLAAAMCALEGPRHGRANEDCLNFMKKVLKELGENATEEQVESYVRALLDRKELIFGFGHAVLRVEDPRATTFFEEANKKYAHEPLVKIANLLRIAAPKVLKENPKISNPYPNVDSISGVMLSVSGFSYPQYFTVLFGLSRIVGIANQIVYERCEARDGKGTPIVRPKYIYKERK